MLFYLILFLGGYAIKNNHAIRNNIVAKKTTEFVLLFHKSITKLIFFWSNWDKKKLQSVFINACYIIKNKIWNYIYFLGINYTYIKCLLETIFS